MSKRTWAAVLIATGFFVILIGLGYAYYRQSLEQISPAPLPDQLAGFPLSKRILGRSAINEFTWMHGQGFPLTKGAVGTYGPDNQFTLYVAGTPMKFMAGRLLIAMRDKIAETNSPFTPLAANEINQRIVYELAGLGQQHYYFRSADLIVWLAADKAQAEEALRQVLIFYP